MFYKTLIYGNRFVNKSLRKIIPSKRYRIPQGLSISDFFQKLAEKDINYVVLRWFDKLPNLAAGGDIDILVADEDYHTLISLLKYSRFGVQCDIYSQTGKPGGLYKGVVPYLPNKLAASMLINKLVLNGIKVPSDRDYFFSLAFHAVYQKGLKSGLPTTTKLNPLKNPDHDFENILGSLSVAAGVKCKMTMEELDACLDQEGLRPSQDVLRALSRFNPWVKAYFQKGLN